MTWIKPTAIAFLSLAFALMGIRWELVTVGVGLLLAAFVVSSSKRSPRSVPQVGRVPPLHAKEIEKICQAIEQGESLLVIGEQGSGKSTVAQEVKTRSSALFRNVAIASYSANAKTFLLNIGRQLKINLTKPKFNSKGEEIGEISMNLDEMKEEIAINLDGNLLIIDNAHRLPPSLKFWLEEVYKNGNQLLLLSITDPAKGIFLMLTKLELPQPTELQIRDIMQREAIALNLSLSPSRLAALQRRVGKNLMLCKKVIRDESMGISSGIEHRDYIDISPFIMAALSTLAIVRFWGLGMGDRTIYIVGGVAMCLAWSFRYIGQGLTRNRRRLGS